MSYDPNETLNFSMLAESPIVRFLSLENDPIERDAIFRLMISMLSAVHQGIGKLSHKEAEFEYSMFLGADWMRRFLVALCKDPSARASAEKRRQLKKALSNIEIALEIQSDPALLQLLTGPTKDRNLADYVPWRDLV